MEHPVERLRAVGATLTPRDAAFLERVYSGGLQKYRERLDAIGFEKLGVVLDAGCGVGQWSITLSERSDRVFGIDVSASRVKTARALAQGIPQLCFQVASVETLPFPDEFFDAVYCYSVLYYTDARCTAAEFARVLRPGGRVYLCSNGIGWYIHNLLAAPNPTPDFAPRRYAIDTLLASGRYFTTGRAPAPGQSIVTPRRWLARLMAQLGVKEIASAGEGCINLAPERRTHPRSFFRSRYYGLEGVFEWLGQKRRR